MLNSNGACLPSWRDTDTMTQPYVCWLLNIQQISHFLRRQLTVHGYQLRNTVLDFRPVVTLKMEDFTMKARARALQ